MAGPWEQYQQPQQGPWTQFNKQPQQPTPEAADAFKRLGVSPEHYDFDPGTNTVRRKAGPWDAFANAVLDAPMPFAPLGIRKTTQVGLGAMQAPSRYWSTYQDMNRESREQMSHGYEQFKEAQGGLDRAKGALQMGFGALGYTTSPISAGLRTVVGKPLEDVTGIPKEYSEFTAGLAMPVLGFGRAPKTLQAIFSPETVSQEAMDAAALIRQNVGRAARDTETTAAQLESWWKPVSKLSTPDQLSIMHYIEGSSGAGASWPATPQLRALADTLRGALEARKAKLQAMPEYATRQFVDDYFPHFWKDPQAAQNFARQFFGSGSKQGSAASLKTRSIPTIADGIRMGLEPLTTNPVEATLRYVTSMDKFIAAQNTLRAAKDTGVVVYRHPNVMGASGHPDSLKGIPLGYAPLEGRGAVDATGARAYAPEAWARVYNNFISRGFDQIGGGEYGAAYNTARHAANSITQTLLSFSGYHAFTMAEATMSNQLAKSIAEMRHLHPMRAAAEFGKLAVAPVRYAAKGKNFRDMYIGKAPMTPEQKHIIDLLTDAGGRLHGTKHALDYESSALGSYLQSFRRGRLQGEMMGQLQDIKTNPVMGTLRTVFSNVGRTMDTFNQPLFQHYIPSIKNAAAYENMAQWLKNNPAATLPEQQAAARKIIDSVDNRFGEMIHDNIFWNKVAKQSAMLAMLSYSWNMGAIREIGGGARDISRTILRGEQWTPKADYVVAMTLNWAIMSSIYQFLKTGEAPKSVQDLAAPRTGGVDSRTGEPERIIPPGPMKDVFGYYEHFGQEVANKMNPALKLFTQSASIASGMGGKDWRDDPILSPRDREQTAWQKAPDWLAEYFNYILRNASPIQAQNLMRGKEAGSELSDFEVALGIRKAPRQLVDPEGNEQMLRSIWARKWRDKLRHDKVEQQRYGGTD